jgi:hypothetical protein
MPLDLKSRHKPEGQGTCPGPSARHEMNKFIAAIILIHLAILIFIIVYLLVSFLLHFFALKEIFAIFCLVFALFKIK